MKISYIYPYWGSEDVPLENFLEKIRQAGFDGIEILIPFEPDFGINLKQLLKITGLKLVGHQHIPPRKESPEEYMNRMERLLLHLISFEPILINSHTGRDFFSFEENSKIIEKIENIKSEAGIPVVHETHRGRFSFSTYTTDLYLKEFPDLRLAADFSHWCCVSESLLEDQEEILEDAINRADHIHARVGNTQAAQVNHPGAPEHRTALNRHLSWWQKIVDKCKKEGMNTLTITTEFGPDPYMPSLPFTQQPVADQWEVNLFMKRFLEENLNP